MRGAYCLKNSCFGRFPCETLIRRNSTPRIEGEKCETRKGESENLAAGVSSCARRCCQWSAQSMSYPSTRKADGLLGMRLHFFEADCFRWPTDARINRGQVESRYLKNETARTTATSDCGGRGFDSSAGAGACRCRTRTRLRGRIAAKLCLAGITDRLPGGAATGHLCSQLLDPERTGAVASGDRGAQRA